MNPVARRFDVIPAEDGTVAEAEERIRHLLMHIVQYDASGNKIGAGGTI